MRDTQAYILDVRKKHLTLRAIITLKFLLGFLWGVAVGYVVTTAAKVAFLMQDIKRIWTNQKARTETPREKKERLKNHYYYHCELNPLGFIRLRNENLSKLIEEQEAKTPSSNPPV